VVAAVDRQATLKSVLQLNSDARSRRLSSAVVAAAGSDADSAAAAVVRTAT